MTNIHFVITGLDPVIHEAPAQAETFDGLPGTRHQQNWNLKPAIADLRPGNDEYCSNPVRSTAPNRLLTRARHHHQAARRIRTMSPNPLPDLMQWYARQCNGEWEHHRGISIESTDNPGWWVKIDLEGTPLQGRAFTAIKEGLDANGHPKAKRWLSCEIKDGQWHGAGDETRLGDIIKHFVTWADGERT